LGQRKRVGRAGAGGGGAGGGGAGGGGAQLFYQCYAPFYQFTLARPFA